MKILIIDIETTGFLYQGGKIVEIGIVELCLNTGYKKIVFDVIINPEMPDAHIKNSWIVDNNYMMIEDIKDGVLFSEIREELQSIINSYPHGATAFNRNFDFDFLESYGIKIPIKLPCPMLQSTDVCKIPKTGRAAFYGGYKWPKVEEAYKHFFPK